MKKVRIVEKNKYNYLLKTTSGEIFFLNIEFYNIEKEPEVGDYIYLSEKILNNKNIYSFGKLTKDIILIDEEDIIKIVTEDREYYLERYYG